MINIGIYGRTNAGKSTLVNFLCGASVSIVSELKGTTTDPVSRRWEIPELDTATIIDTAGLDDNTQLGEKRIAKTMQTLDKINLAIIVTQNEIGDIEHHLIDKLGKTPHLIVSWKNYPKTPDELIQKIRTKVEQNTTLPFYGDKLTENQTVVLICPVDNGAPNGRMILPQMQAVRAALDMHCKIIVIQPEELTQTLATSQPNLIVTDASVIALVKNLITTNVPLTSFSELLAAQKGDVDEYKKGLDAINLLHKNDPVLIIEHCSHHATCGDIGREKIPASLNEYVGTTLDYTFVTNRDPLPVNLDHYKLAIQCGGCMTTPKHIGNIIEKLKANEIPTTNYGMLLAKIATKKL